MFANDLLLCLVRICGSEVELHRSLGCRRGRVRSLRSLGRSGLEFFAGVSRRFHAPLALVMNRVRALLRMRAFAPAICGGVLEVCGDDLRLHRLVKRLLSFHGRRRKRVGVGMDERGLIAFLCRGCLLFLRCTDDGGVGFGFGGRRRSVRM